MQASFHSVSSACQVFEHCFILSTRVNLGFSYSDKQYTLINPVTTFDKAVSICRNRNERLVQIRSKDENDFIFNTIVAPLRLKLALGATNTIGLNGFKWLDGSAMKYSNWQTGYPIVKPNQQSFVVMTPGTGEWYNYQLPASKWTIQYTVEWTVLCEKTVSVLPVKFDSKTSQLDKSFNDIINTSKTQRNEYMKLIEDVKQDSQFKHGQLVGSIKEIAEKCDVQQNAVNKLQSDVGIDLERNERQNNELIRLNTDVERYMIVIEELKSRTRTKDEVFDEKIAKLRQQNEFLQMRLNHLELKMSTNIVTNSNKP